MDWWTLGFQAANFLVLVWLLQHFLYQPVMEIMEQRKGEVDRVYADAAAAKAAADAARAEYETMRADAAKAAARMMDEAKDAALRERNAMVDQARADAENIAAAARAADRPRTRSGRAPAPRADRARWAWRLRRCCCVSRSRPMAQRRYWPIGRCGCLKQCRVRSASAWLVTSGGFRGGIRQRRTALGPGPESAANGSPTALGREVAVDFTQDSGLIAGVELRLPHSVVNCSWKQSLAQALKAVLDGDGNAAGKS